MIILYLQSIRNSNMNLHKPLLLLTIIASFLLVSASAEDSPTSIIDGIKYLGHYTASQPGQTFNYLDGRQGNIRAIFYASSSAEKVNSLDLYLFDPLYTDRKVVFIQIQEILNIQDGQWINPSHKITYTTLWKGAMDADNTVEGVETEIVFENYQNEDYKDIRVTVSMKGDNFDFQGQMTFESETLANLAASMFITLVVAVEAYSAWRMLTIAGIPNVVYCNKISLLTLSLCTAQDLTQVVNNIPYVVGSYSLQINQSFQLSYLFYVIPTLGYFFMFGIIQLKIMLFVWRCHNLQVVENPRLFKRKLTIAYIFFLGQYFAIFVLGLFFINEEWFIIIVYSTLLLPQLVRNVRIGHFPNFDGWYIFGYVGMRLLIPVYQRMCPENRFSLAPNQTVVVVLLAIYAFQVILLYIQFKLGSRFFVPKRFRPNFYDYKVKITLAQQNKDLDCTVCLQNLFEIAPEASSSNMVNSYEGNQMISQPLLKDKVKVMRTPCNHHFHEECLTQWMNVKLECPTCRRQLPPI